MFIVSPKFDVSLRGLQTLKREGYFVARSAHVGNQYLSNKLLYASGIPALLFDRNLFQRDINYHPGRIVRKGGESELGHVRGLVPFGAGVCDAHLKPLKALFGDLCQTEAVYFTKHRTLVSQVFGLMQRHKPGVFDRYLCDCGQVHKLLLCGDTFVCQCDICGYRSVRADQLADSALALLDSVCAAELGLEFNLRSGVLWSLPLHLVLESLLNVLDSGRNEVYQLSGPDMIRYTKNRAWLDEVRWVWAVLQKQAASFGISIPSQITVWVVPTADLRFGYVAGHEAGRLVVEGLLGLEAYKQDRTSPARKEYVAQVLHGLPSWNVFYDIQDSSSWPCSHHDLAEQRQQLVIPEHIEQMTMEDLRKFSVDSASRIAAARARM